MQAHARAGRQTTPAPQLPKPYLRWWQQAEPRAELTTVHSDAPQLAKPTDQQHLRETQRLCARQPEERVRGPIALSDGPEQRVSSPGRGPSPAAAPSSPASALPWPSQSSPSGSVVSARSADSSSARGPARAKQQAAQLRQLEIELTAPAEPTVRMAEGSLQESRAVQEDPDKKRPPKVKIRPGEDGFFVVPGRARQRPACPTPRVCASSKLTTPHPAPRDPPRLRPLVVLGAPETLIGVKSRSRLFATGRRLNEHEEGA